MNKDIELQNAVILPDINPGTLTFGSLDPYPVKEIFPNSDCSAFLPTFETQANTYFDDFGCFPYDANVLMEDFSNKRISEVKVGDYVFTHKGNKKKVIQTHKYNHNGGLYSISVFGIDNKIFATKEHPILTKRGWVKAEELLISDYVLCPTISNYNKDSAIYEVEKDKDFLWFLGLFIAEGNFGSSNKISNNNTKLKVNGTGDGSGIINFSLHEDETDYANRIIEIGKVLFNTKFTIRNVTRSHGLSVNGYNYHLKELLLELCGRHCDKKFINKRLMLLKPELQLEILRGWLDGDGSIKKKGTINGVSTSKNIITNMGIICGRNNIPYSINKRSKVVGKKDAWSLSIYGENINKVFKLKYTRKNRGDIKISLYKNYISRKIKLIKYSKTIQGNNSSRQQTIKRVYTLGIEDDNSFIVEGVAVHNCVSHSFQNGVETLIKATLRRDEWLLQNIYKNGHPDFSDRDLVVLSGTIPGIGNSGQKVLQTAQNRGLIPQTAGDWDTSGRDPKMVQELYYAYTRTKEGEALAKAFNERHKITGTWVHRNNWEEAMKEGVLQVYVKAWYRNSEGKYYNPTPGFYNHAVTAVSYKDISIFDTYQPAIKQLTSWNDAHIWALKINITKIMPTKVQMENNTLVQLVEGTGGAGLYLDDKIFVGRPDEALFAWNMRNTGNYLDKKRSLTQEQWDMFEHYNFKNEKL